MKLSDTIIGKLTHIFKNLVFCILQIPSSDFIGIVVSCNLTKRCSQANATHSKYNHVSNKLNCYIYTHQNMHIKFVFAQFYIYTFYIILSLYIITSNNMDLLTIDSSVTLISIELTCMQTIHEPGTTRMTKQWFRNFLLNLLHLAMTFHL